jgi:hypothetical protein
VLRAIARRDGYAWHAKRISKSQFPFISQLFAIPEPTFKARIADASDSELAHLVL